jgi:hypothetical protein
MGNAGEVKAKHLAKGEVMKTRITAHFKVPLEKIGYAPMLEIPRALPLRRFAQLLLSGTLSMHLALPTTRAI